MRSVIRKATPADVAAITGIYNGAIAEGGLTGDLTPLSIDNRNDWYNDHRGNYAVFAAEDESGVVGYAALSPYRKGREAFAGTCEISYYVAAAHRGRGLGKRLIDHALKHAQGAGFDVAVAILLGGNRRSIAMLGQFGFTESGRIPMAAKVDGRYDDHVYFSRRLASKPQSQ